MTLTTPLLEKFKRSCRTVPVNMRVEFEVRSFNHLELLAFNGQKFRGHVSLATPPFRKILRDNVQTVYVNMHVKFEVRSFNRFGAVWSC